MSDFYEKTTKFYFDSTIFDVYTFINQLIKE